VDVSGYFTGNTAANKYSPITPVRALDTTLTATGSRDVPVAGYAASIPGLTPVAVVINLTAANPSTSTWLAAYPTPTIATPPPLVSNLNLAAHAIRANLATVPIGAGGAITVFNKFGSTRTAIDIVGFYGTGATGALAYYPLPPTRIMDTRNATNTILGSTTPSGPGATIQLPLLGTTTTAYGIVTVPATARAFVYTLTGVTPTASTYLTAYGPPTITRPGTSTLNLPPQSVVPNLAITGSDATGLTAIYNRFGVIHIVADLAGYYAP
jgi:hypothetical protein